MYSYLILKKLSLRAKHKAPGSIHSGGSRPDRIPNTVCILVQRVKSDQAANISKADYLEFLLFLLCLAAQSSETSTETMDSWGQNLEIIQTHRKGVALKQETI